MGERLYLLLLMGISMGVGVVIGFLCGRDITLESFQRRRLRWACETCGATDKEGDRTRIKEHEPYGCPECGNFTYQSRVISRLPWHRPLRPTLTTDKEK